MLPPSITLTVCPSSIMPEFTRPTSITVSADEDCMAIVISVPNIRLVDVCEVIFCNVDCSFPPAIFSSPALIACMPYRKSASPPNKDIMENTSITSVSP